MSSLHLLIGVFVCLTPLTTIVRAQHSPTVANHTNVCFGRNEGRERHLTNCAQFFQCRLGHPTLINCAQNQLYSHVTQQCELTSTALRNQCFACPNRTSHINLPADYQCRQFVRCFQGVPEQRTCSEGLLFDSQTGTCNFAERVKCACPAVDRPGEPLFVRDTHNCTMFNVCARGVHVPLTCPTGLHFNRTSNQCDTQNEQKCIQWDLENNRTTVAPTLTTTWRPQTTNTISPSIPPITAVPTTRAPFSCPVKDDITFEPNPEDCTTFFICAYGTATLSPCPQGSWFDRVSRACVDASAATCAV